MSPRPRANAFIDSCAFDPDNASEDAAAAEIFRIHQTEDLSLIIAHSTQKEIDHPNTPEWVKREARSKVYSVQVKLTAPEERLKARLLSILTGNGQPENMRQDAEHIFEAQKYGAYFVTTDHRLLKKAREVARECNLQILLPSEFLAIVKS
jgi:hypothetical protein